MHNREHLGVGIVGAGFIADFHAKSWMSVRDADLVAVTSRSADSARRLKDIIEERRVGTAVALHASAADLARDPRVDAIWVLAPNYAKVEVVREICEEVSAGRANLGGIAIEKPLGRTLAEARTILELVEGAGLKHGYLENQVFSPGHRATPRAAVGPRRTASPATRTWPLRRGAQRPAQGLVLGRPGAGRRGAQRHDVPLRWKRAATSSPRPAPAPVTG